MRVDTPSGEVWVELVGEYVCVSISKTEFQELIDDALDSFEDLNLEDLDLVVSDFAALITHLKSDMIIARGRYLAKSIEQAQIVRELDYAIEGEPCQTETSNTSSASNA